MMRSNVSRLHYDNTSHDDDDDDIDDDDDNDDDEDDDDSVASNWELDSQPYLRL